LHPRMHEPKNRVVEIVVEEKTLTRLKHQMDLFGGALSNTE